MRKFLALLVLVMTNQLAHAQVDLVVNTNANSTTCSVQNDTLYAFARIENQGLTVVGNFSVGFYLTSDITTDPTLDHFVGSDIVGTLAGGGVTDVQIAISLSDINGVPDGTYYLGVYVDDLFAKTETDETNNGFTMTNHSQMVFPLSLAIASDGILVKVSVYPNPVLDVFYLDFTQELGKTYSIELYDVSGKMIREEPFNSGQVASFKRGAEKAGLYYVVIRDDIGNMVSTSELILSK